MLSRLDTFTGLKVTHVNPTYLSKMEGHVIFTFTLFQIYELGGVGWRSPGESGGQILLYIHPAERGVHSQDIVANRSSEGKYKINKNPHFNFSKLLF